MAVREVDPQDKRELCSYYVVNDHNAASRGLAESFGGEGRVLYHCYDKRLD